MKKFYIPEKEKCPPNGYQLTYSKGTIDEFCENPWYYKAHMYIGAINDAITIYKYNEHISRDWVEHVIRILSKYI